MVRRKLIFIRIVNGLKKELLKERIKRRYEASYFSAYLTQRKKTRKPIIKPSMKIYTRTGDDGKTGLFGAGRVSKHHPRVESYGTVDETNAFIGKALAEMVSLNLSPVSAFLLEAQADLFVLGGDLAAPEDTKYALPRIQPSHIAKLESWIDTLSLDLAPLKNFILPSGHAAAATLHIARTVCRRAERMVVLLGDVESLRPEIQQYLNRLSDFLFVAARWVNHKTQTPETPWLP